MAMIPHIAATAPAASKAATSSSPPNLGLMIWTLVVFGVTMVLLARLAFPRISEALDKRQRAIDRLDRHGPAHARGSRGDSWRNTASG